MSAAITPIAMPKWGLEMREGTVTAWLVEEGARIEVGTPILDVETDKISNAVEAADAGTLRRKVAAEGETLPVKALLGVLAEADVGDADIDAFIAGYVVPAAGEDEDESASAFREVTVAGLKVRVARRGPEGADAGVPVLFVHGFGGDLGNWMFNLDAVAAAHPVIALDLPAHGQSTPRLPGTSLAELAGFVAAVLDALDVPRVHAVGHSLGGAIAAKLALDQPGRVASLALVAPAGLGEQVSAEYIEGFVGAASRRELKPVAEMLFADPALVTRALLDELLKYKRLDGIDVALRALADAQFAGGRQRERPLAGLAAVRAPVWVAWGGEDRVIPATQAEALPPSVALTVFDGAGHMPMMEKASDFNAALLRHLAGAAA